MPAINLPNQHFNTALWTANVANPTTGQKSISLGFQPDLVWSKNRDNSEAHYLIDSVRGDNSGLKWLRSNAQAAEGSDAVSSSTAKYVFTSTGFDIVDTDSTSGEVYYTSTSRTYVGWSWKAGGTAVTNTDGSITSQVSANRTAGFSVITYTGTGANANVGHGLGVAPSMVFYKKRNGAYDGCVYHKSIGASKRLVLFATDGTIAEGTDSTFFQSTDPDTSKLYLGTREHLNAAYNYVAYCFAPIAGYSAFGSFTGNGAADGPFVYTGFRPAFVMARLSSGIGDWNIVDNKRQPYNDASGNPVLRANSNGQEEDVDTMQGQMDLLSNGFKIRSNSSSLNASNGTIIYAAFAEAPFKFANAR